MWNSISGRLSFISSGRFGLEQGGMEWVFEASGHTLADMPAVSGNVRIYCHLLLKDETFNLYGFSTQEERHLFLKLISVSGVGPKSALCIFSQFSPQKLAHALEQDDVDTLSGIKGLGRKTAQKIVLSLRGSLVLEQSQAELKDAQGDLLRAFVEMGYESKKVQKVIQTIVSEMIKDQSEMLLDEQYLFQEVLKALNV